MTIDDIVKLTEAQTEQVNIYLTNKIVDRIMAVMETEDVKLIPSSRRDIIKMLNTGKTLTQIEKDVESQIPSMKKEIQQAFKDVANIIEREQDGFLEAYIGQSGINVPHHKPRTGVFVPTKALYITATEKALIESNYRRTLGTLINLTRTTATTTQVVLIEILDEAFNKVTRGVSLHTATAEAIKQYAQIGTMVDYNGHKQRLEVAVTRAVRTGLEQASGDVALDRCKTMEVSQVIVSSHLGARYTDKDEPANHMSWQGKVYDYPTSGRNQNDLDSVGSELYQIGQMLPKTREDSAGDFLTITGYGTGEGLCGWNCRHTFSPFFKGMKNNFEDYNSTANQKQYDLEQKQRYKERHIRELKRTYEAMKHAYKSAQGTLKDTLKPQYDLTHKKFTDAVYAYNDWCTANGLRAKPERFRIS